MKGVNDIFFVKKGVNDMLMRRIRTPISLEASPPPQLKGRRGHMDSIVSKCNVRHIVLQLFLYVT